LRKSSIGKGGIGDSGIAVDDITEGGTARSLEPLLLPHRSTCVAHTHDEMIVPQQMMHMCTQVSC
jgi:hypothetical protein